MPASLSIFLREYDEPARLVAEGDIDIRTVDEFVAALTRATTRHDRLIVDFTRVDFLCVDGVEALDSHTDALVAVVVGTHSPVGRVLRAGGLQRWIVHQPDTGIRSGADPPQLAGRLAR